MYSRWPVDHPNYVPVHQRRRRRRKSDSRSGTELNTNMNTSTSTSTSAAGGLESRIEAETHRARGTEGGA